MSAVFTDLAKQGCDVEGVCARFSSSDWLKTEARCCKPCSQNRSPKSLQLKYSPTRLVDGAITLAHIESAGDSGPGFLKVNIFATALMTREVVRQCRKRRNGCVFMRKGKTRCGFGCCTAP
ncbi:hypothetical protein ElyMa_006104500 [Elysia marginata]|uniref:Uncharacterized protein n=1 Tax=Elysia marginata TaxID=1093978 RepID=A0AAV4GSX5_9GAST|nr:hypothetical protein ElyMa_006104500 [Elysia marginata]